MSVGHDLDDELLALDLALDKQGETLLQHEGMLEIQRARFMALEARVTKLEASIVVPQPVSTLGLGAVSYYYPGIRWDALLLRKPRVVIINPNSGPGQAANTAYQAQVQKAHVAGAKVLAYVWTDYGKRSVEAVQTDIQKYRSWYNIDGIFLDEASNTALMLPYYDSLCYGIRNQGLLVCLNSGVPTTEDYAKIADYLMVSEGTAANYLAAQFRPAWETMPAYAGKCWHAVHSCPVGSMPAVVALAKKRGAGLLWVTDDVMTNPYDTNPTYLDSLAVAVAAP